MFSFYFKDLIEERAKFDMLQKIIVFLFMIRLGQKFEGTYLAKGGEQYLNLGYVFLFGRLFMMLEVIANVNENSDV